ncbi:hypothetical protein UFOVP1522_53 [uncultured Caudovirales phage]|uniref:Uncharacterized protein n=1 Tax=uncultured Caudovirales phage TaxID=2100421 RepID=A0A6J5SB67_9CAUD|nr:hypothetical protein UFOVP989_34 [uncultured Caudovirales phage]CAB4181361.1 hypothetical protein UFOVP1075_32 [uncultured Caudovirales phage]CAB4198733.1 hypothetical protein UFOVP1312_24 [uncultured Caudovirales phage]CAB4210702.1 hypothetical protein UFOVP1426_34 [uncultured Caudovirales phage]CAB5227553.1 hypothetical protein UFOVP1522_53 [uncultured Caudovirales phage]
MAFTDATYPWAARYTLGTMNHKNLYSFSWGFTHFQKKISAASATAILTSATGATAAQTITAGVSSPDVPRALSVTPTVNAIGQPFSITITGTNVEGKVITEAFIVAANSTTVINGLKAFKSVTNVLLPAGTNGLTVTVGTQNIIGLRHRLFKNNTTVKVYQLTTVYGTPVLQGVPVVTANEKDIEFNTYLPATLPGGTTFHIAAYTYDNWSIAPFQDQPEYSTTTSTSSTSSSTSTTTITTSTSSTSSSISSTSTSSTSSSTSSTSTSTTTTP